MNSSVNTTDQEHLFNSFCLFFLQENSCFYQKHLPINYPSSRFWSITYMLGVLGLTELYNVSDGVMVSPCHKLEGSGLDSPCNQTVWYFHWVILSVHLAVEYTLSSVIRLVVSLWFQSDLGTAKNTEQTNAFVTWTSSPAAICQWEL